MRIAIDGNEANIEEKTGVHQYAFEILYNIYRIASKSTTKYHFTIFLKNTSRSDMPKETDWWKYIVLPGEKVWILTKLMPHLLFHREHDVLFVPSHYVPPILRIPTVCTIHDLGYLEFSGQFKRYDFWQLKLWTAISLIVSKYIISVSNATKKDIVRRYHRIDRNKVKTIYHGYDKVRYNQNVSAATIKNIIKKYKIPNNYILYLGTLKPSKNIEGIIRAFSKTKNKEQLKLVIAGKRGWLYESIYELVKKERLQDKIIFTGYINENDKPALYSGAKLLMSPSFWEGFGMQVMEAFACGTPAVVSRVASLPEVAGKAGIYVNPNDISDITKKTEMVLQMDKLEYNQLQKKCIKQAENFSWEKAANDTLKVLEQSSKNA
ncbi:glycosyltransferase family 4 protein [Patescibacteria group bacterium]